MPVTYRAVVQCASALARLYREYPDPAHPAIVISVNDVGKVLGMEGGDESAGGVSVIKAQIPLAEMLRYSIDLRGMTSGKATFEMKFSHYDPISGREADNVIAARKKLLEEEAAK